MENVIELTCPKCCGTLQVAQDRTTCVACQAEFEIRDQIPVLRQNPETYYGEFPQAEMIQLLQSSATDLETSIREYLRQKDAPPRLGEYILGRGRAGWQYLLPLDRESRVLDLGCGWGTLAWSLAQFCGHVVACDSTLERMQLLGLRRQLDRLKNLQLVCAGDCRYLPFGDDSFDGVVVNGVLEWVPSGLPGEPRDVQAAFLKEIRRVLKPNGFLFLGIENRYAWKTWAMNPDGHTGLRYVPWLPRGLANWYSKSQGKGEYRNYLYGPSQYKDLLRECGFDDTQFFVPCPGYHHPVRMIPFEDKPELEAAFARQEDSPFRRFRQKIKAHLSARFPDAFGMVASDQQRPSFLDQLIRHLRTELGVSAGGRSSKWNYRMNGEMGIVTVLTKGDRDPFIVKLPLHERGRRELVAESEILESVVEEDHPLSDHRDLFARVRLKGTFKGQDFWAYSLLPGVSGDRLERGSALAGKAVSEAAGFLASLHQSSVVDPVSLDDLVVPVGQAVASLAKDDSERGIVDRVVAEVLEQFGSSFKGAVWSHGDSKLANFMFDPRSAKLTGVIDWGTGFQPELPGYDVSFLLVSSSAAKTRTSVAEQLRRYYRAGSDEADRSILRDFVNTTKWEISDPQFRALIAYQWMKRLAPLADEYETMRFNHRYLASMFRLMADK